MRWTNLQDNNLRSIHLYQNRTTYQTGVITQIQLDVGGNATVCVSWFKWSNRRFFFLHSFVRVKFFLCTVYKLFVVQTVFLDFHIVQLRIRMWKRRKTSANRVERIRRFYSLCWYRKEVWFKWLYCDVNVSTLYYACKLLNTTTRLIHSPTDLSGGSYQYVLAKTLNEFVYLEIKLLRFKCNTQTFQNHCHSQYFRECGHP